MYTVIVNGIAIQCETAADAIDLARQAGADGGAASHSTSGQNHTDGAGSTSRWTEQRIQVFFGYIKENQRRLVDALMGTPDAMTAEQLCKHLGMSNGGALAGVFTGLWKNAKKAGADPEQLYIRNSVSIGDKRQYEYTLAEPFRSAVRKYRK